MVLAACLFLLGAPAFAQDDVQDVPGDPVAGAKVFSANCAACHIGGGNAINPSKTLKKEVLEKYNKFSHAAIVNQANKGAGAMPSFKRLGEEAIDNVAAYVLQQAEAGW